MSGGRPPDHPSGRKQGVKIYLPPEHLTILDLLVEKHGKSRSWVVQRLLERTRPKDPVQEAAKRMRQ